MAREWRAEDRNSLFEVSPGGPVDRLKAWWCRRAFSLGDQMYPPKETQGEVMTSVLRVLSLRCL